MFNLMKEEFVDLAKLSLVHVYQSLNQPQVSPGQGMVAQSASAFLMVCRNSPTVIEIFIGLYFSEANQRVLYHSTPFPAEVVEEKIAEAEAFVGEMGFLMDNLHFSTANATERNDILRRIPFFYSDFELYLQALSESEIEARNAKAEAITHRGAQVDFQRVFLEKYVQMVSML
ncbi:MAG: hypothetical protein J0L93_09735 [Deltaproteobacteria bacterium]|nr:hypothetical protein [Deltaproteobacteria bacterium]